MVDNESPPVVASSPVLVVVDYDLSAEMAFSELCWWRSGSSRKIRGKFTAKHLNLSRFPVSYPVIEIFPEPGSGKFWKCGGAVGNSLEDAESDEIYSGGSGRPAPQLYVTQRLRNYCRPDRASSPQRLFFPLVSALCQVRQSSVLVLFRLLYNVVDLWLAVIRGAWPVPTAFLCR
jgi:hypothetical protein